jgi:hypothetical protein
MSIKTGAMVEIVDISIQQKFWMDMIDALNRPDGAGQIRLRLIGGNTHDIALDRICAEDWLTT